MRKGFLEISSRGMTGWSLKVSKLSELLDGSDSRNPRNVKRPRRLRRSLFHGGDDGNRTRVISLED